MSGRVRIIQSNYLPWRGYFDFIDECDVFIFLDDVQYTRRDWRSRNKIKAKTGVTWISVPVSCTYGETLIEDAAIDYSHPWRESHLESIRHAYCRAGYFHKYFDQLAELLRVEYPSISELNQALIRWICRELQITTHLINSSDCQSTGVRNEKLLSLMKTTGGTEYLTGPAALGYLDKEAFAKEGISILVKEYNYPEYPQLWGDYASSVSVMDLLFNTGDESRSFLKSTPPFRTL